MHRKNPRGDAMRPQQILKKCRRARHRDAPEREAEEAAAREVGEVCGFGADGDEGLGVDGEGAADEGDGVLG